MTLCRSIDRALSFMARGTPDSTPTAVPAYCQYPPQPGIKRKSCTSAPQQCNTNNHIINDDNPGWLARCQLQAQC
ncbi:MAG TPA: hypothetical protein V6D15_11360 [Oculatellaceae cyanobacterium]